MTESSHEGLCCYYPRSIDKETIAINSVVSSRYSKEPVKLETFKIQLQVCQIRSDFLPDDEFV